MNEVLITMVIALPLLITLLIFYIIKFRLKNKEEIDYGVNNMVTVIDLDDKERKKLVRIGYKSKKRGNYAYFPFYDKFMYYERVGNNYFLKK